MHLRPEYQTDLASKGGWLTIFIIFAFLALLAFMRGAAASVVSGGVGGVSGLALTFVTLVALTGLLMRKRWSYYLFVLFGIFMLIQLGLAMLASPDKLFYTDWKFDVPVVFEWLLVLVWTAYFLRSRRVYSVLFGDTSAPSA